MSRCLLIGVLWVALLSQSGCAFYLQRTRPLVEGRVVDAGSGLALSGVTLEAEGSDPMDLEAGLFRVCDSEWRLRLFYTVGGT